MTCRIVVMLSGSGSTLQALLDYRAAGRSGKGDIVGVFSNRADAYGLERARRAGVETRHKDHRDYASREEFDAAALAAIEAWQPDLVVLAGYMRIMTDTFVTRFSGRMLNVHPSLLPLYPGLHTHRRALEAGDREHGSSIHFVTPALDNGPLILQGQVPVLDGDTEDQLRERVQKLERQMYPMVVRWFADGRLRLSNTGAPELDGARLSEKGLNWPVMEAHRKEI